MVKVINDLAEFDALIADKTVIVDFYADWCGPCKMIGPSFEYMAENPGNLIYIKVDVDEGSEISTKYGITAMPTFKVFKNGEAVDEMKGADKKALGDLIAKYQ